MRPELVLALVDGDLYALDGRRGDVGETSTDVVLSVRETRVRLTHGVSVECWFSWYREPEDVVAQCPTGGHIGVSVTDKRGNRKCT